MARYVECPEEYVANAGEQSLFLAGGITGCADWQAALRGLLAEAPLALINPRRATYDFGDLAAAEQQIAWEFRHLRAATMISFWFAAEQIQPISLYELGAWSMSQKQIFVGDGFALERQRPPWLVDHSGIELAERHRIDEVAAEAIRHRQFDLRMGRGEFQDRIDQDALRDGRDHPEAYLPAQLASGFDDLFARPSETGHHRQEQAVQAATFGGWLHALRSAYEETLPHLRLELGHLHAECRLDDVQAACRAGH